MKFIILAVALVTSINAQADDSQRIEDLERQVKTLTEKVNKMESTFNKGGGFMLTPHFTCVIETPFNGTYSATELSETAAREGAITKCNDNSAARGTGQCTNMNVKCPKTTAQ